MWGLCVMDFIIMTGLWKRTFGANPINLEYEVFEQRYVLSSEQLPFNTKEHGQPRVSSGILEETKGEERAKVMFFSVSWILVSFPFPKENFPTWSWGKRQKVHVVNPVKSCRFIFPISQPTDKFFFRCESPPQKISVILPRMPPPSQIVKYSHWFFFEWN